ncbi:MAG TPA: biotin--[acetyl-CoA-carboxylase] ligase [Gemmatimonadales bacterium]|nr:biotin--[acetyl-CoA-carboxylase] ligase [Gemmatimonadales bacterium]
MAPRLYHFERVGSTMDVIHQLAANGAEAGTAVMAGEQLEGRGSRGRTWHSPSGGLWLSMLFRPRSVAGVEVTSIRIGLAVAEAVDRFAAHPVELKWPNDLVLDDRKLGGVLCEARWQGDALGWIAVGLGMNVRNPIPDDLSAVAISLAAGRPDITPEGVADPIVMALRRLDLGAGRLSAGEMEQFARRDWLRGRQVQEPLSGTAAGLQDDGALLVRPVRGPAVPLRSGPVELAAISPSR